MTVDQWFGTAIALLYPMLFAGAAILKKISRQLDDLHNVHLGPNAFDVSGAPKWYSNQHLDDALTGLTEVLKEIHQQQRDASIASKETIRLLRKLGERE